MKTAEDYAIEIRDMLPKGETRQPMGALTELIQAIKNESFYDGITKAVIEIEESIHLGDVGKAVLSMRDKK